MGSAREMVFEILAIDGASEIFKRVGRASEEASAKVEASGEATKKGSAIGAMALAGLAAGAGFVAVKSLQMAAQFQTGMNTLVTSAGESPKALGMVGDGIKSLSIQTATSTQQLISGMYMIESAGYHAGSGLTVLKSAAQGAKSENADLATVTNALTTEMKDYHIPVDRSTQAMNALIATTSAGKTHLQDLAAAFPMVGPVAASMHVSLQEVGGAMATMTAQGNSAEVSAMDLAAAMTAFVKPNKVAVAAMESVGLSSTKVANTMTHQGLAAALNMVADAAGRKFPVGSAGYNKALESMMGKMPAFRAALALTGKNAGDMATNVRSVGAALNRSGHQVDGFSVVQKSFNFQLGQFQQTVNVAMITLGQKLLPVATRFMGVLTQTVPKIGAVVGWLEKHKTVAEALGVVVSALLIPPLIRLGVTSTVSAAKTVAAFAASTASSYAAGVKFVWTAGVATVSAARTAAAWVASNAMILASQARMLIVVGAAYVRMGAQSAIQAARAAGPWIASFASQAAAAVAAGVKMIGELAAEAAGAVASAATTVTALGVEAAGWVADAVAATAAFIAENAALLGIPILIAAVVAAVVWLATHWRQTFDFIKSITETVVGFVIDHWKLIISIVLGPLGIMIALVATYWRQIYEAIVTAINWIIDFVTSHWRLIISILLGPLGIAVALITKYWSQIGAGLSSLYSGVIKPTFGFIATAVKTGVDFWVSEYKILWNFVWNDFGQKLMQFFTVTIPNWLRQGYNLFVNIFITPWRIAFQNLYNWVWNDFGQPIMRFFISTLPGWIRTGMSSVTNAMRSFATAMETPVNWVIQHVYDGGIEQIWDTIAGVFHGPTLPSIGNLPSFATGGVMPISPTMTNGPMAIVGEGNPRYPEYVIPTDPKYRNRAATLWASAGGDLQMLAGGGILGGLGSALGGIGGLLGGILSPLKNLVLGGLQAAAKTAFNGINSLMTHIPGAGTPIGQMLTGGVKTAEQGLLTLLGQKDAAAANYSGAGAATSAQVLAWIQQAMSLDGVSGGGWLNGLETIIHYESGGNPNAQNNTDSNAAAGDPSRGLMQTIMSTFMAYHEPGTSFNIFDPVANIAAGINYIRSRYGGIGNVPGLVSLSHGGSYVGYRTGGVLPAGGVGLVGEDGPELIYGGRTGATISPLSAKGGDGSFVAELHLMLDGQLIDRQLVRFQRTGGTLQSAQAEIKRSVAPSARTNG